MIALHLDALGAMGVAAVAVVVVLGADADVRRAPGRIAAGTAAALACVAGEVALLVPVWLAASVTARLAARAVAGATPAPGADDYRAALGVLGDALVGAALVLVVVDGGGGALPWPGEGGAVPGWAPALVALGIALRAMATGVREPILMVVASVVTARILTGAGWELDPPVVVAVALAAGVVAWTEGGLPAALILSLGMGGLSDPAATDAAVLLAAALAVVTGATSLARSRGRAAPAGLTLLALAPALIALLRAPMTSESEGMVVTTGGLAVAAAAAVTVGSSARASEGASPLVAAVGLATAAGTLSVPLLAPGPVFDALGVAPEGREAAIEAPLERGRGALMGAAAFAVALTLPVTLPSPRRKAPPGEP